MKILSNDLLIRCDERSTKVEIFSVGSELNGPAISVTRDTLSKMSLDEAAKFLGERVILLSPVLREYFREYLWSENGEPPKKGPDDRR